ncbi:hypothetical protein BHM03_00021134 [Ensete ventricosum]|nr:hypothetical protein BHM03_00021134 [Ensete ventricosum]
MSISSNTLFTLLSVTTPGDVSSPREGEATSSPREARTGRFHEASAMNGDRETGEQRRLPPSSPSTDTARKRSRRRRLIPSPHAGRRFFSPRGEKQRFLPKKPARGDFTKPRRWMGIRRRESSVGFHPLLPLLSPSVDTAQKQSTTIKIDHYHPTATGDNQN